MAIEGNSKACHLRIKKGRDGVKRREKKERGRETERGRQKEGREGKAPPL